MITRTDNMPNDQIDSQLAISAPVISTKQSVSHDGEEYLPISEIVSMLKEKGIKPHNIYNWYNRGSVRRIHHPSNDTAYMYSVADVTRQVEKGLGPVRGIITNKHQAAKAAPVRDSIILKLTEIVATEREKNKELTAHLKAVTQERDELIEYLDSLTAPKGEFTPEEAAALKYLGIEV